MDCDVECGSGGGVISAEPEFELADDDAQAVARRDGVCSEDKGHCTGSDGDEGEWDGWDTAEGTHAEGNCKVVGVAGAGLLMLVLEDCNEIVLFARGCGNENWGAGPMSAAEESGVTEDEEGVVDWGNTCDGSPCEIGSVWGCV